MMNAPTTIPPLHILAAKIVTNEFDGLPATDQPYYSNDEWLTAAQCALDGDYSELDFMLRFEKAHAVWVRKTEAFQMRWAEDCKTWFDAIGVHQFPSGLGVAA
jgi:hypothetical protein